MSAQQKIRVEIPYGYTPQQRNEIGKAIVDFIVMRTLGENTDKKNKSFASYRAEYAERKGSETVNLSLTGDMLANLQVLRTYTTYITIGYAPDYDGMGKVEGNRKGTYGQDTPVTEPRDFLGLTQGDLNYILQDFTKEETLAESQQSLLQTARQRTPAQREALAREAFLQNAGLSTNFI